MAVRHGPGPRHESLPTRQEREARRVTNGNAGMPNQPRDLRDRRAGDGASFVCRAWRIPPN